MVRYTPAPLLAGEETLQNSFDLLLFLRAHANNCVVPLRIAFFIGAPRGD